MIDEDWPAPEPTMDEDWPAPDPRDVATSWPSPAPENSEETAAAIDQPVGTYGYLECGCDIAAVIITGQHLAGCEHQ